MKDLLFKMQSPQRFFGSFLATRKNEKSSIMFKTISATVFAVLLFSLVPKSAFGLDHSINIGYNRFNSELGTVDGFWLDYNLVFGKETVRNGLQFSFGRLPYVNASTDMRYRCGFFGVSYIKPLVFYKGGGRFIVRPGLGLVLGDARQDDLAERNDSLGSCLGCGDRNASPRLYLSPNLTAEADIRLKGGFGAGLGLGYRHFLDISGNLALDVPAAPKFYESYGAFLAVSYGW